MRARALRRRCRILLRELDIQPPLRVEQFAARLGEHQGRPIELIPEPLPPGGPGGVWRRVGNVDRIYFESATTSLHQMHIILHEFGHMIAGHDPEADGQDWSALLSDLSPEFLARLLARSVAEAHLNTPAETEAEHIATVILEWNDILSGAPVLIGDHGGPAELARWDRVLRERRGWQ